MRLGIRFLGLVSSVAWLAACSADGTMADTDGDTDTDTDTDPVTTMGVTLSSTTASPTTTAGNTMSGSGPQTTTITSTTDNTGSSTTDASSGTTMVEEETGCTPGTEGCPCDVGSTCEGELVCVDGTCEAPAACDQLDEEPNDGFDEAIDLGAVMCSMEYATADGTLDGLDADFYTLTEGQGGGFCLDPDPQVTVMADQDVRVCIYMACDDGTNELFCGGSQEADTFDELNGCCATNGARLFSAGCGFVFPPDPVFYIRVSSADEEACIPYEMSYRFN